MSQPRTRTQVAALKRSFPGRELLELVANGSSIRSIVKLAADRGVPSSTYFVCKTLQSFGDAYSEAKKMKGELLAGKLEEVNASVEAGTLDQASARVIGDNAKWLAARLDPASWGDRVTVETKIDFGEMHLLALKKFNMAVTARVVDDRRTLEHDTAGDDAPLRRLTDDNDHGRS